MPLRIKRKKWREASNNIRDKVLLIERTSRNYHTLYFSEDSQEIVAVLRQIKNTPPEMLSIDYWRKIGEESCGLRLIPAIRIKEMSGWKRKGNFYEYMETESMTACKGKCKRDHVCRSVVVPAGLRKIVTCECRPT